MRAGVVLPGPAVLALERGRVPHQLFQPSVAIVMEAALVVIDEDAGCAVPGIGTGNVASTGLLWKWIEIVRAFAK